MDAKEFKLVPNQHGGYDFIELPELEEFEAFTAKEELPTPDLLKYELKPDCECDPEFVFFFGKHSCKEAK